MTDRMVELAKLLDEAMERGDLETARKLAAEQRRNIERDYRERERMSLAADSF
jgi:hypothetical protein